VTVGSVRKFIAALVGAAVIYAHNHGVEVAEDVSEPVIALITAGAVYILRNDA
jgi:hypothetical protein